VVGAITGGTGRYAGAEGVASAQVTESNRRQQVEHFTLTFVP
jgi:hypothetical protein